MRHTRILVGGGSIILFIVTAAEIISSPLRNPLFRFFLSLPFPASATNIEFYVRILGRCQFHIFARSRTLKTRYFATHGKMKRVLCSSLSVTEYGGHTTSYPSSVVNKFHSVKYAMFWERPRANWQIHRNSNVDDSSNSSFFSSSQNNWFSPTRSSDTKTWSYFSASHRVFWQKKRREGFQTSILAVKPSFVLSSSLFYSRLRSYKINFAQLRTSL